MHDRLLLAAGAAPVEETLYVEDVFSSYAYSGTGASQTITNGLNLSGNGGLVWIKTRNASSDHYLFDTVRGVNNELSSNAIQANTAMANSLSAFNSNGFSISTTAAINTSGAPYMSWSFREAPKFLDIVQYTGTGSVQNISHSLGIAPGCIMIKATSTTSNWTVYHRSLGEGAFVQLNTTALSTASATAFNNTAPTSSVFTVGADTAVNQSGVTYIAYVFAHDDTSNGIIECGVLPMDASGQGFADLGWEPQWLLVKRTTVTAGSWEIVDNTRQLTANGASYLYANLNNTEVAYPTQRYVYTRSNGFGMLSQTANSNYIYIAIRNGLMRTPTSGASVFSPTAYTATNVDGRLVNTGIFTDTVFARNRNNTSAGGFYVGDRTRANNSLATAGAVSENADIDSFMSSTSGGWGSSFGVMNGFGVGNDSVRRLNYLSDSVIAYALKRARGFYDVACYTGQSTTKSVTHNLGVVPELIIVKNRGANLNWPVYSSVTGIGQGMLLNSTDAATATYDYWDSAPTATTFSVISADIVNTTSNNYVAYLFATCPGVSKVGSYTGNGSTLTVDCGFSGGARFVMIKRTSGTGGDWWVWDTARGIVANNDPRLAFNLTGVEVSTTDDSIDTDSSGFIVNQNANTEVNASGSTYLYLAIA